VLTLSIRPKRLKLPLATFEGQIRVGQEKAAIAEEITLTYAFAEEVAQPAGQVPGDSASPVAVETPASKAASA
jgi:hypothetical protein